MRDDDAVFEHGRKRNYALRRGVVVVVVVAAAIGLAFLIKPMFEKGDAKKKNVVHQIMLLKPPPPPPPPPKEEKPPEIKKEEVKIEEPKPQETPQEADAKPAGEQLGLDADGSAGSDGFGLAARKGGTDLLSTGGGQKGAWYAGMIQQHFLAELQKNRNLRGQEFRVVVNVWLRADGSVQRTELVGSSGKPDTDEQIKLAFGDLPPMREAPPNDMPQPVRLRLTNRL